MIQSYKCDGYGFHTLFFVFSVNKEITFSKSLITGVVAAVGNARMTTKEPFGMLISSLRSPCLNCLANLWRPTEPETLLLIFNPHFGGNWFSV